jgi:hypothetical protein
MILWVIEFPRPPPLIAEICRRHPSFKTGSGSDVFELQELLAFLPAEHIGSAVSATIVGLIAKPRINIILGL